jgi:hypothetical protein
MSDKQHAANRRNALQSTGPKTPEGADASKMNALRHGLRTVQTVIPGESPEDWETHRNAVVQALAPQGAVELALAEQVAVKFWRIGRVVRYEADLIANSQAEDELLQAHELIHARGPCATSPTRTDIPTRQDVANARHAAENAAKKLTEQAAALGQLQGLAAMGDEDALPDWALYTFLLEDFRPDKDAVEDLFRGESVSPFLARHARKLILNCFGDNGELDGLQVGLEAVWAEKLKQLKQETHNRQVEHESLARRYKEALERRRLASALPDAKDLEKIQRYETHLERGLHMDLDRLHQFKEARGAVPPQGPSVAVAVVQAGREAAAKSEMGSFGKIGIETAARSEMGSFGKTDIEAAEKAKEPAGVETQN